jgi:hypothetical protein
MFPRVKEVRHLGEYRLQSRLTLHREGSIMVV